MVNSSSEESKCCLYPVSIIDRSHCTKSNSKNREGAMYVKGRLGVYCQSIMTAHIS